MGSTVGVTTSMLPSRVQKVVRSVQQQRKNTPMIFVWQFAKHSLLSRDITKLTIESKTFQNHKWKVKNN